jgi:hypothetical protein
MASHKVQSSMQQTLRDRERPFGSVVEALPGMVPALLQQRRHLKASCDAAHARHPAAPGVRWLLESIHACR